jgi:hypothetical protein
MAKTKECSGEGIPNLSGDVVTKLRHKERFTFSHLPHPLEGVKQHSTYSAYVYEAQYVLFEANWQKSETIILPCTGELRIRGRQFVMADEQSVDRYRTPPTKGVCNSPIFSPVPALTVPGQ